MTWDVATGHDQEYFEFVVREFLPGVQRLGFELSDAWATAYGNRPQILIGAILPNRSKAQQLLESADWKSLNNKLQDYITNYSEKIVPARSGFQF
jgi:hypothetical protein